MNFLAHIYLSFDDTEITLGNFFADHIRGNKFEHLPEKIQKGIRLHREIDTFTDAHPIAKQSSRRLHKNHGHYSRVIVDIFYDHFLAKHWHNYSEVPLENYTTDFYKVLLENYELLPTRTKHLLPYMIADNWLLSYAQLSGVSSALKGMDQRTKNRSKMYRALLDLEKHYNTFEREFIAFFEELVVFSHQKYIALCDA